jgi:hypothetical protein
MAKKGTEEEFLRVLLVAESGNTVVEIAHGISQQKRNAAGPNKSGELLRLREEHAKHTGQIARNLTKAVLGQAHGHYSGHPKGTPQAYVSARGQLGDSPDMLDFRVEMNLRLYITVQR